jgi:hypothetical protein
VGHQKASTTSCVGGERDVISSPRPRKLSILDVVRGVQDPLEDVEALIAPDATAASL